MDSQGTRALEALEGLEALKALKALGHSKGTWALEHSRNLGTWALEALGHSKGTWALGHSRHLGTWPLRHLGTQALQRHLVTWALRHSKGTWSLGHSGTRTLEALYLADSEKKDGIIEQKEGEWVVVLKNQNRKKMTFGFVMDLLRIHIHDGDTN